MEISCHGSPYIQQSIIQACINKGARLARAGEFTQRAFLNGKLDLTQAEAVADLIASNTKASQRTALNNIRGGFSVQLKEMREQLIQFASLIELELPPQPAAKATFRATSAQHSANIRNPVDQSLRSEEHTSELQSPC